MLPQPQTKYSQILNKLSIVNGDIIKNTLHNIERAKEFLAAHLPEKIKEYVDLNKELELINKEFIKKNQRELRCDVLYKTYIKNTEGYIFAHIEAQSKPEKLLSIRLLAYNLELITWHWQNKKVIPPIINLVLYNGKESPYPYKINFLDFIDDYPLAKEVFFNGNQLIDLTLHDDNEIEKHKKIGLMELLLKHSRQKDFYNFLENLKKSGKFKMLLSYYDKNYLEGILLFIADILNSKDHDDEEITELFVGISETIDKDIMTVRQAMEYKYTQRGIQQEKFAVAKNLLKMNLDLQSIQKATGLSKEELEEICKKK